MKYSQEYLTNSCKFYSAASRVHISEDYACIVHNKIKKPPIDELFLDKKKVNPHTLKII